MKQGIFYAVGIGAGNPMNITCRAKEILESADVIIAPVSEKYANSSALHIVQQSIDISHAEILHIIFPMQKNINYQDYLRSDILLPVFDKLEQCLNVAMITLGDVSIYSTAGYVRQVIAEAGYTTQTISGIPSFVAGAAQAQINLCESQESLLILPATNHSDRIRQAFRYEDNIIIMKAGNALTWLLPLLTEHHLFDKTIMFRNIGMDDEYIGIPNAEPISYFTTLLIRKGGLR